MQPQSIFSYWWFWLMIIGLILILLAAVLHLTIKDNTQWVWWIFAAGALLVLIGIVLWFVSYFNQPTCGVTEEKESSCPKVVPMPEDGPYTPKMDISMSNINLPQAQRGFTTSATEISALAPSQ